MIARLTLRYLAVFAIVLAILSAGAYMFLALEYQALLQPALGTPEAARAYRAAMERVTLTILAFDLPLLAVVGGAAWLLARASIEPLLEARERERAFAADAAHRLRSPLATIAAVAQAAGPDAPEPFASSFETIVGAALDASQAVGELLTLSRPAAPGLLHREPIDVALLARSVCKEFEPMASGHGLHLSVTVQNAIVDADEWRLRELVRNLLENAVRHARSSIAVTTQTDSRYVEIAVSNDGDCVDPELHERVFERAFSMDGEGSGLGLALVRWIARAHGGDAFVRDRNQGGAEFVVRLPVLRENEKAPFEG